ncbi:MAG: hypothetical protein ACHQK8_02410 [Bacteroidia bacterium]
MKLSISCFFILIFFKTELLLAQDSSHQTVPKYISVAIGAGGGNLGLSTHANVALHKKSNSVSIGFIYSDEFNRNGPILATIYFPSSKIWEVNLCLHHSFLETKKFKTTAGIGVNYSSGIRRGMLIYGSHSTIVPGGNEYHQPINFSVIGMDLSLSEEFKINKNFSLALTAFGNLNPEKTNYGILLSVVVNIYK